MDRKDLLRTIYERIGDKSRLHGGKRVESVEHLQDSVKVHTADGGEYVADILVGVDGVHSQVRKEMHRRAAELGIADEYDDEEGMQRFQWIYQTPPPGPSLSPSLSSPTMRIYY